MEIHGNHIRLWGVDAPESTQLCRGEDSDQYRCGAQAANDLAAFIAKRPVNCDPISLDRYGRTVATCTVGDVDLGEWLVGMGSLSAFLLFERVFTIPIVPAQLQDISARASALTAAMSTQPSNTAGLVGEHNKPDKISISNEPEFPDTVERITAPSAVAATDIAGVVPAISEAGVKNAKYYRQRGSLAYRSGDLPLALIDFDLAIELDPNFSDAYIDRAIVFRRLGDLKRAFADVAQAKRIDDLQPQ